jgi:hypothetical protein
MASVFANPRLMRLRRLLPHIPAVFPKEWQPAPKPLSTARTIHGVRQETPARTVLRRSLDPARSSAAVLPTFYRNRRDAVAIATMRSTDEASPTQVSQFRVSTISNSRRPPSRKKPAITP